MKLEQYIEKEKQLLDRFAELYKADSEISPEFFPLEQEVGEWGESFIDFVIQEDYNKNKIV